MPSPVVGGRAKFYKRPDGAWIKDKGNFIKVGADKYKNRQHYSKHMPKLDRRRKATKSWKRERYPQIYD